jgi:hypothetical protein
LVAERFLSGDFKRVGSAADRYQVVVHIDQALLVRAAGATSATRAAGATSTTGSTAAERIEIADCTACSECNGHIERTEHTYCRECTDHPECSERAKHTGHTDCTACTERTGPLPEHVLGDYLPSLGRCELKDGHVLAIETARRLACDASLVGLVEDENGEPLNVGRKTRSISPALNRALRSRDGGCRFPGCDRRLFVEGHHVVHWANGGETKLSNLILLCGFHHGLVHEGGFGLEATDDGVFVFTRPDGSTIEQNGRARARLLKSYRMQDSAWSPGSSAGTNAEHPLELFALNRERGLDIDATTGRCRWTGERLDYHLAIGYMAACRDEARWRAEADSPHPE